MTTVWDVNQGKIAVFLPSHHLQSYPLSMLSILSPNSLVSSIPTSSILSTLALPNAMRLYRSLSKRLGYVNPSNNRPSKRHNLYTVTRAQIDTSKEIYAMIIQEMILFANIMQEKLQPQQQQQQAQQIQAEAVAVTVTAAVADEEKQEEHYDTSHVLKEVTKEEEAAEEGFDFSDADDDHDNEEEEDENTTTKGKDLLNYYHQLVQDKEETPSSSSTVNANVSSSGKEGKVVVSLPSPFADFVELTVTQLLDLTVVGSDEEEEGEEEEEEEEGNEVRKSPLQRKEIPEELFYHQFLTTQVIIILLYVMICYDMIM